jgi:hypothetical protein
VEGGSESNKSTVGDFRILFFGENVGDDFDKTEGFLRVVFVKEENGIARIQLMTCQRIERKKQCILEDECNIGHLQRPVVRVSDGLVNQRIDLW